MCGKFSHAQILSLDILFFGNTGTVIFNDGAVQVAPVNCNAYTTCKGCLVDSKSTALQCVYCKAKKVGFGGSCVDTAQSSAVCSTRDLVQDCQEPQVGANNQTVQSTSSTAPLLATTDVLSINPTTPTDNNSSSSNALVTIIVIVVVVTVLLLVVCTSIFVCVIKSKTSHSSQPQSPTPMDTYSPVGAPANTTYLYSTT